jgi:hypothetical protein
MNRFTVVWWDDALDELAQLWIDATDRAAINDAALSVDVELSRTPDSKGREVSEGLWRIDLSPIRAYYQLSEDDRLVTIIGVRRVQ